MRGRDIVGRNIRRIRVEQGLSQERLAYDSGVDRSYLGGMERGAENPTVDVLDRIAATLRVPLCDFFEESTTSSGVRGLAPGRKGRA